MRFMNHHTSLSLAIVGELLQRHLDEERAIANRSPSQKRVLQHLQPHQMAEDFAPIQGSTM